MTPASLIRRFVLLFVFFPTAILIAAMILAILPARAGTAEPTPKGEVNVPPLNFTDTKLPNGLRVILAVDHTAPVYAIDVCYNVGSRNERPGRTGFAHLFEHMMFEGSQNVGKGEHFILVLNNGGGMNGTTNEDRTTYFETLPKNQLDLGLFLESDRMRALAITQPNLDNQRNAVQEERRLGVDNQPYGKSELEIDNLSYDNFAYKHSTIGSMSDLNAASIDDVRDFFRIYYAPNNAVLTVVGDVDPDATLEKVKHYFGSIPSQPAPPSPDLSEEEHYGERRDTVYDALARLPEISMAYHIPRGNTPENRAARALSIILGGGQSSRFYQHLVKEKQLALQVYAYTDARIGPSLLYITAIPRPGVKVKDLEKAIDDELSVAARDGITAQELTKAQAFLRRQWIQQRSTDLGTAVAIGDYAVRFNDPNLINELGAEYAALTVGEVNNAAKKYLERDQRTVIITLPEKSAAHAANGGAQ
ncbi:MAG: pitrilysin family protein [Candidatus Acidiferrales bacterium]